MPRFSQHLPLEEGEEASLLGEHMTSLSGARMHDVCRALAIATGCD
jgi:hypothetical protein